MKRNVVLLLIVLAVMCFARPAGAAIATDKAFIENWAVKYSGAPAEAQYENIVLAAVDFDTQSDEDVYENMYNITPVDSQLTDIIINAAADSDGDGSPDNEDCAPANPNIYPGAPDDDCDDTDNNCIGGPDDEYAPDSSCFSAQPGVCAAGNAASTCVAGVETAC
ncbi:MAG: hypothetical protein JW832_00215, partial [Deltaproteobacteria bacterium]|nr:hypothetical protein [Deltaproteobacteria bacterium]